MTPPATSAQLRYLGVAGWLIETGGFGLLIDPFFTRLSMRRVLFGKATPNAPVIRQHVPPADAILITHPHFDHLMDAPIVAQTTGAVVFASPQGCDLLRILGLPDRQMTPIHPDQTLAIGPLQITVHPTPHRAIFGGIPYQGALRPDLKPPLRASDYRMDFQYSFLIAAGPLRILVASGIAHEPAVQADVLLFGADATRDQISRALQPIRPRIVFPNHWDDMFRPLSQPIRPMIVPPPGIIPNLRRIDLRAFRDVVRRIDPEIKVILPGLFEPYTLA